MDASFDSADFRDVIIVGGGCYGTFYAGQLERAQQRGKARFRRLIVVDRDPNCQIARELGEEDTRRLVVQDWAEFFDRYFDQVVPAPAGHPADTVVPSPLMPHLMYQWLFRRAQRRWPDRRIETHAVDHSPGTPFDKAAPDGTRYVSYADWICPTHCIEPAICPVIRAPRTWEMSQAMEELTRSLGSSRPTAGPVLFICQHRVFGVGMFDVSAVLDGDGVVAEAGKPGASVDVLVGTISSCHGAVNLLHLGPRPPGL